MTYDYLLKKVTTIVSDQVGMDAALCRPDALLGDDLGADSLDLVSIVLDVETELGIEIPEDDAEAVKTIDDLARVAAVQLRIEVAS